MGADAVDFFLKRTRKERAYSLTRSGCRLIQRVEERYYGCACYRFFLKRMKKERDYSLTRTGCSLIKRVQSRHHGCACCRKKKKGQSKHQEKPDLLICRNKL